MTIDLRATIAPKSDQLNADDLIGGPRTILVTKVALRSEDQPVAIHFEGDDGKPYKPCKSMRRVLVTAWGPDGTAYAGRSMTLYRDEEVAFGGQKVGGIRISHLSHIDRPLTMALTVTRAQRKPYQVKPLQVQQQAPRQSAAAVDVAGVMAAAEAAAANGSEAYKAFFTSLEKTARAALLPSHEALKAKAAEADAGKPQSDAEKAIEQLTACTSEAELDAVWETLPVEVCREIGAGVLEDLRERLTGAA